MEKKEVKKWQDEEALKRYRMIAPLLDPDLDEGKRQQMREETAGKNGVSKRALYRYEKGYREEGSGGLRPAGRAKKRQQRLPENFEEIMGQAVQLKREVPKRSVRQIIKVPELEGWAQPGVLKPSAVQRHLYEAGLGRKQMKRHAEKRTVSSRRFRRPHRMELLQGDIKYGPAPLSARRMEIGAFASKVPPVPVGMTGNIPETSRLLDALEKKYKEDHGQMARALSFGDYGKGAENRV